MRALEMACPEAATVEWQHVGCSGKLTASTVVHMRHWNWRRGEIPTVIVRSYLPGTGMLSISD